ncbi:MAG: GumC family protein [Gammaproteobacteria bacterium]
MQPESATLGDYIDIVRRRKAPMLSVITVLSLVAMIVAVSLPSVYRSTATIRIEQQGIPDDIVRTTVNTYADTQIENIKQRVVTGDNLARIVTELGLADQLGHPASTDVLAGEMIESVFIEPVGAEVVDPRTGKPRVATIAFNVSYESERPRVAKKSATALADVFLSENAASRTAMAADTAGFITEQAEKWRQEIADMEARIATFKSDNAGSLPELSALNLRLMEGTERDLRENQERIRSLQQQRIYLEGERAQVKPYATSLGSDGKPILSPAERLDILRNEYSSKLAVYSSEHPDVVKLRKEIASLASQSKTETGDRVAIETELASARADLDAARQRYSAEHPDVRKLTRKVDGLESSLKAIATAMPGPQQPMRRPDNPAYIGLQARLEAATTDLRTLVATEAQLRAKLSEYEARLTASPQVERQYQALQREHEAAVNEYNKIKGKQREAELAEQLEIRNKGERYSLVSAASLPDTPYKPKRILIALFGIIVAFTGGIGTAVLAEALDRTVRGAKILVATINAPLLGVIPYIENSSDRSARRRRRIVTAVAVALCLTCAGVIIQTQVSPLQQVWSVTIDRLGYRPEQIEAVTP